MAFPVLEYSLGNRLNLQVAVFCVVGGGVILYSIVPRIDRFAPPGRLITADEHPRLFSLISDIARQMKTSMPAAVYLVPNVNAFVTQRGGILGWRSRRIMGLGMPLLAVENISQLRAILAHEFGHFVGGETKLASLVYLTRSAMIRTLQNLHAAGSSTLRRPFEGMLRIYVRITHAISRQRELRADAWAVQLAGAEAFITGLMALRMHDTGFQLFLQNEIAPLHRMGIAPRNYFEGYRQYTKSSGWHGIKPTIEAAVREEKTGKYDSHPALQDRLAFARTVPSPATLEDPTLAFTLLEDWQATEAELSRPLHDPSASLVSWTDVGAAWRDSWARMAARTQARVDGMNIAKLRQVMQEPVARESFAEAVDPFIVGYRLADRDEAIRRATIPHAAAWLASLLGRHGYECQASPGEPVRLARGVDAVDVFTLLSTIADGKTPRSQLDTLIERAGLMNDAAWPLEAKDRNALLAPAALVALRRDKRYTEVKARLDQTRFPRCCALCCGPGDRVVEYPFSVGGFLSSPDDRVKLPIVLCEVHRYQGAQALNVERLDRSTTQVTLHVTSADYADLIVRCNA